MPEKDMSAPHLMKTPKSKLTAKQPLTKKKKNTETYHKRYPTSKDKEEATRQSEGAMVIKSNPIPPLPEWATHKGENNLITELPPQE